MNGNGNGHSKISITTSTGISIGIVIVMAAAIVSGVMAFSSLRNDLTATNTEMKNLNEKVDIRLKAIESNKNNWSYLEMYKWAVKLQQTNKDPKKLQTDGLLVPEPESIIK